MADTRINALSTATVSLSDDFLPIDGTTAGTKKLSAYSPTFGGNATVTGTLTGNSTITGANLISSVNSGAANGSEFTAFSALVGTDASLGPCRINIGALPSATFGSRYGYIACYDSGDYRKLYLGGSPGIAATGGQILIPATIASTTTSSGALVVGNGTSGGLGVGGSIYAGGSLALVGTASSIATSSADSMARIGYGLFTKDQAVTIGLSRRANYGDALISRNLEGQSGTDAYITSETTAGSGYGGFEIQHAGVARILVGSGATTANAVVTPTVAASFTTTTAAVSTVLQVINSTASTGTSSGALVVSGGVGVAGAIFAGGDITSTGSGAQEIVCESTTGANYAGVISKNNSGNTFNLYSLGSTYGGTVFGGVSGSNQAVLEGSASISSICISHANPTGKIIIAPNRTNALMVENSLVTVASGVDLKLGNAYVAGAPTATGYIVIKDSTGTSYKIPAVAL